MAKAKNNIVIKADGLERMKRISSQAQEALKVKKPNLDKALPKANVKKMMK